MNRHTPWWRIIAVVAIAALGACKGGSSSSGGGNFTLTAMGGEGLAGDGGDGGYFGIEDYSGGDAAVLSSGRVNTDFAVPKLLPYLGTNPWDVTADATLEVGTTGFHFLEGSDTVYDAEGAPVTGIRVRPGVTLTVYPNYDNESYDGLLDTAQFYLDDGLIVEGTIRIETKEDATATANFVPDYTGGMWIASSGRIDVSGESSTSGPGANGGRFQAHPDFFFNAGVIDTSGGSGSNGGGGGGGISVYTDNGGALNTGSLLANGGAGGTGEGGDASSIYFEGDGEQSYCVSSGTISATGGDGATGGGDGAYMYFYSYYGNMLISGTVRTYGGDATDEAQNGSGGAGGEVQAEAYGSVRWAGTLDTHGGDGVGLGSGGTGGMLDIDTYYNYLETPDYAYPLNSQWVAFGADVNLNGGKGAAGGDAGDFDIYTEQEDEAGPGGAALKLVGYRSVDVSGGPGSVNGGDAGDDNYIEAWGDYYDSCFYYTGNVINQVPITMRGGEGRGGYGGAGYGITMDTEAYPYAPFVYGVTNSGDLDGTGGSGTTDGGAGGDFFLHGYSFVNNTGAITASGGAGGTGTGGYPDEIELYSEGTVTSAGALTINGGASDSGNGYQGGSVYLQAADVCTVRADVTASGGGSASETGGAGGYIWVLGQGAPSAISGRLTAAAGAGGEPPEGEVWVDGGQISGPSHPVVFAVGE